MAAAAGAVAALSLVAGSAGGWVAGRNAATGDNGTSSASSEVDRSSLDLSGDTLDVAGVISAVEQSVVSIETDIQTQQGPFVTEGQGAGTGIVLDSSGLILTNAHVIADATSISVTVSGDDSPRDATLVAADDDADIAVLQVDDTDGLVAAPLGEGDAVQVGDDVVAIGNALALEGGMTVTQGIVSAVDREIDTGSATMTGLIQTDAAISSGKSGGPLVNAEGEVIGINTFVAASSQTVAASNIGFAIDIDKALDVVKHLTGEQTT